MDPLDESTLARRSSCDRSEIRRLVSLGLIVPVDRGGLYDPGDVMRVRLLSSLERSGVDLAEVSTAVREGRLSLGFAGQVVADQPALTERSYARALEEASIEAVVAHRLYMALGLPPPSPEDPIREDDLEILSIVAAARRIGIADDAILRAMRSFGMSVRHIVEVQREFFRESVEDRMLDRGVGHHDMLQAGAEMRIQLQRLGYRVIFLLQRRYLEQAVLENLVTRFEEFLDEHDISRAAGGRERAIAFVDLTGYTRLTEEYGDERAASHGMRLVEIALNVCAESKARLVKALGDGVLLMHDEPATAVGSALDIVERVLDAGLPPARAGVATGPVVQRDGDVFGRTVNVAARLVGVASPGSVVVTERTVEVARSEGLSFTRGGVHELEGLEESIPLFVATRASSSDEG